jgi:hypothetical protein
VVRARSAPALLAFALAAAAIGAGCGTTEEAGKVGDTLSAKGLEVTVKDVDTSVPVNEGDITGLSQPSAESEFVGTRVKVCSDHGGAIGPYDFGVETTDGEQGTLKFPQRNYAKGFESRREGCGGGWVVFEIPSGSKPETVKFGFEDTGTAREYQDIVDAEFSWSVG